MYIYIYICICVFKKKPLQVLPSKNFFWSAVPPPRETVCLPLFFPNEGIMTRLKEASSALPTSVKTAWRLVLFS